jgi:lipid A 3-O-deacylase
MKILWIFLFVFLLHNFSEIFAEGGKKHIAFSTAVFDILQQDNPSFEGRVEVHGTEFYWMLKPLTGVMFNTDGALHLFGGVMIDIPVFSFLYISPSIAPGFYHKSESKDLKFLIEFRSQFELAVILDNDIRVGLSIDHISNASLGKTNPGVESIALTYHFPL